MCTLIAMRRLVCIIKDAPLTMGCICLNTHHQRTGWLTMSGALCWQFNANMKCTCSFNRRKSSQHIIPSDGQDEQSNGFVCQQTDGWAKWVLWAADLRTECLRRHQQCYFKWINSLSKDGSFELINSLGGKQFKMDAMIVQRCRQNWNSKLKNRAISESTFRVNWMAPQWFDWWKKRP